MFELLFGFAFLFTIGWLCEQYQDRQAYKRWLNEERWIQAQVLQDEQLQDHMVDKLLNTRRFERVSKFDER